MTRYFKSMNQMTHSTCLQHLFVRTYSSFASNYERECHDCMHTITRKRYLWVKTKRRTRPKSERLNERLKSNGNSPSTPSLLLKKRIRLKQHLTLLKQTHIIKETIKDTRTKRDIKKEKKQTVSCTPSLL